ncbi:MAG: adenine-specific methyltransferase EcoRI family protein [bacterium]|nr:adenine-specific methyltransferase EcoRI family protein [bacterium]
MANNNLTSAKKARNDEFYTQYEDIQKEVQAYIDYNPDVFRGKVVYLNCDDPYESNFFKFFANKFNAYGIKKLVATSYFNSPVAGTELQVALLPDMPDKEISLVKKSAPQTNTTTEDGETKGRVIEITEVADENGDGIYDLEDIKKIIQANGGGKSLKGDDDFLPGDFRSKECVELLKQADIVVTNPPFSLFREYVAQLFEHDKKFLIIGNMNAITYKEFFPKIMENKTWLGPTISSGDREFMVPESYPITAAGWRIDEYGRKYIRIKGIRWFTNLDHGKRHQELRLMTMAENRKFNKKVIGSDVCYKKYDNYDAIEVSFTDAIPSDYAGVMGVPISFLDKYNPDQFEIVAFRKGDDGKDLVVSVERERERESCRPAVLQNTHSKNSGIQQPTGREPMLTDKRNMQEYSYATSIPGLIKNAEGKINGKITYARVTIRRKGA